MLFRLCALGLALSLAAGVTGCSACHHGSTCASPVPLPPPPGPAPCPSCGTPGVPPPPVPVGPPAAAYSVPVTPAPPVANGTVRYPY
jgi:hypothetical protein